MCADGEMASRNLLLLLLNFSSSSLREKSFIKSLSFKIFFVQSMEIRKVVSILYTTF